MTKDNEPELVPELKQGHYSDGHPLDEVHYLECKIILKPDRFTSKQGFFDFARIVKHAAEKAEIDLSTSHLDDQRPQIREVVFLDTADFRLYNHAFILRRRVLYEDGFPVGDPEIVFKFRHPDEQKAAAVDVRPKISGKYRIKFKAEAVPLKDQIGGLRILYSHNCQFGESQAHEADRTAMSTLARVFPALSTVKTSNEERVSLVSGAIVEEVLLHLGELDFGKAIVAKCDISLWRTRGEHMPLVGEFAFQARFDRKQDVHHKPKEVAEQFFVSLQQDLQDWLLLGTTKTGMVYRMNGNAPQSHE
jgi:hypothetical protein